MPNKVERLRAIPRRASETGVIYYTKPGKKGATRTFEVRPRVVYELCRWLRANARAYKELDIIDSTDFGGSGEPLASEQALDARMDQLPDAPQSLEYANIEPAADAEVVEDTGPAPCQNAVAEEEDFDTSSGFCAVLPAPNVQASIDGALASASAAARGESGGSSVPVFASGDGSSATESVGSEVDPTSPVFHVSGAQQAVSEFDADYFVMAFPEIFLTGEADLYADRPVKISTPAWLQHVLWTGDQRAARHKVFPFLAFSFQQRHRAMDQGSYFVNTRVDQTDDAANSVEDLAERIGNGDNSLAQSVFFWAANITGSDAHLGQLKREIDAIITDQLMSDEPNPPSLFLSGSCAEFYWKQLLTYLAKHVLAVECEGAWVWDKEEKAEVFDATINQRWEASASPLPVPHIAQPCIDEALPCPQLSQSSSL